MTMNNLSKKTHENTLASCIALLVGFTLAVGGSIDSYATSFIIGLPIVIALYFETRRAKTK